MRTFVIAWFIMTFGWATAMIASSYETSDEYIWLIGFTFGSISGAYIGYKNGNKK